MSVPSIDLEPGLYRFSIKVNATDRDGRPVRGSANFSFELRPRSTDAEPELRRREALRRFSKKDYAGARQAAADLLQIHPNSVHAYVILAMIAEEDRRPEEAASHRKNAHAISNSRRDQLAEKYTRPIVD